MSKTSRECTQRGKCYSDIYEYLLKNSTKQKPFTAKKIKLYIEEFVNHGLVTYDISNIHRNLDLLEMDGKIKRVDEKKKRNIEWYVPNNFSDIEIIALSDLVYFSNQLNDLEKSDMLSKLKNLKGDKFDPLFYYEKINKEDYMGLEVGVLEKIETIGLAMKNFNTIKIHLDDNDSAYTTHEIAPVTVLRRDGQYYMLGFVQSGTKNDRKGLESRILTGFKSVEIVKGSNIKKLDDYKTINVKEYLNTHPSMYSFGKTLEVVFNYHGTITSNIELIKAKKIKRETNNKYLVNSAKMYVNEGSFCSWAMKFPGKIQVVSPESTVEIMQNNIKKSARANNVVLNANQPNDPEGDIYKSLKVLEPKNSSYEKLCDYWNPLLEACNKNKAYTKLPIIIQRHLEKSKTKKMGD